MNVQDRLTRMMVECDQELDALYVELQAVNDRIEAVDQRYYTLSRALDLVKLGEETIAIQCGSMGVLNAPSV